MQFGPFKATRKITERQKTDDGRGWKWIEAGKLTADIYLTIDLDAIARDLGCKAIGNKNRRSKYMGGVVVVEAVNIRKETEVPMREGRVANGEAQKPR
jgi:hypothetical protein